MKNLSYVLTAILAVSVIGCSSDKNGRQDKGGDNNQQVQVEAQAKIVALHEANNGDTAYEMEIRIPNRQGTSHEVYKTVMELPAEYKDTQAVVGSVKKSENKGISLMTWGRDVKQLLVGTNADFSANSDRIYEFNRVTDEDGKFTTEFKLAKKTSGQSMGSIQFEVEKFHRNAGGPGGMTYAFSDEISDSFGFVQLESQQMIIDEANNTTTYNYGDQEARNGWVFDAGEMREMTAEELADESDFEFFQQAQQENEEAEVRVEQPEVSQETNEDGNTVYSWGGAKQGGYTWETAGYDENGMAIKERKDLNQREEDQAAAN